MNWLPLMGMSSCVMPMTCLLMTLSIQAAYRHLIGCLLVIVTPSRADILLSTSILALFVSKPTD